MAVNLLISKLISFGYSPVEVDYSLIEILQHKNANLLDKNDFKILVAMIEERIQHERAVQLSMQKCY